ncbi:hypothetical protein KIN20_006183 [Parelaphostrongylus tenuis]|uniref:Uncharacterized protein n=1 Tax=Parelaphostrongylus tenuis TaxID=148309 RepID=A0AAD5MM75_PARTN|nr:hypothetical protein KIN20_006183 [Parelaphostrongylus tenuis]
MDDFYPNDEVFLINSSYSPAVLFYFRLIMLVMASFSALMHIVFIMISGGVFLSTGLNINFVHFYLPLQRIVCIFFPMKVDTILCRQVILVCFSINNKPKLCSGLNLMRYIKQTLCK